MLLPRPSQAISASLCTLEVSALYIHSFLSRFRVEAIHKLVAAKSTFLFPEEASLHLRSLTEEVDDQ